MKWLKRAIAGAIVCVVLYNLLEFAWLKGWLIRIPATRDPDLVGTWDATWATSGRKRQIVLLSDGTGQIPGIGRILWGTSNGVLHAKCRSAGEGWDEGHAPYKANPVGKAVAFVEPHSFMIPSTMIRTSVASN